MHLTIITTIVSEPGKFAVYVFGFLREALSVFYQTLSCSDANEHILLSTLKVRPLLSLSLFHSHTHHSQGAHTLSLTHLKSQHEHTTHCDTHARRSHRSLSHTHRQSLMHTLCLSLISLSVFLSPSLSLLLSFFRSFPLSVSLFLLSVHLHTP